MPPDAATTHEMFLRFLAALFERGGCNLPALTLRFSQQMAAASIESAALQQDDAEISQVDVRFGDDSFAISARVRVKGRAWPPRPPLDTRVSVRAVGFEVVDDGKSGRLECRIADPLQFSSAFADLLAGLFGRLLRPLPVPLDLLRKRDARVAIQFDELVRTARPDLAPSADRVCLFGLRVEEGRASVEVGFRA